MSVTVVSDPSDYTSNSYASVAWADEYVDDRVQSPTVRAAWTALTTDEKGTLLVNASRTLDTSAEWIGDRYSSQQILGWPRVNAYYDSFLIDTPAYPPRVQEATVEMALWSMTNSGATSVQNGSAFDAIKVGPLTIDFNEAAGVPAVNYFPDIVAQLLNGYGLLSKPNVPGSNIAKTVRLIRA